jgi:hypothetical protein
MANETETVGAKLDTERARFRQLILENPNYFGNLPESPFKPVKPIKVNTTYEELTCVGFNPQTNFLEATIAVKLPNGYGGTLCMAGTTEYVRFFVDYGSGWEDAGVTGVKVHDIPAAKDCSGAATKPLMYVASLRLKPKTKCCNHAVVPKVHAILSWEWMPPAGAANVNWTPPWGNTRDCHIQIKPNPWTIACIFDLFSEGLGNKLKFPQIFEQVKYQPIPLPDPPPFTLAELAKQYNVQGGKAESTGVETHRFATQELHAALTSAGGFNLKSISAQTQVWKSIGLDMAAALAALNETNANVSYEQLQCLGMDESQPERLVATFRVKRPEGYSGQLCYPGSQEYVAFWADWDNTCQWTYLGTVAVNVHDLKKDFPQDGICYSAILPVDLTYHRRTCKEPKIARVRAVLSWAVPPSPTNPDSLNYWGNRIDAHVQINPGDPIGEPKAIIRNIGGIPLEDISTSTTGMTTPSAVFAHSPASPADSWGLGRPCPFGGSIRVEGPFFNGYFYRVKAHKLGDPYSSFKVLGDSFQLERWSSPPSFDEQISTGGFFAYSDPLQYVDFTLAVWAAGADGDDLWDIQLDIATAPNEASIIGSTPWYRVQLDNTGPAGPPAVPLTMDIHITSGFGDCQDTKQGDVITGIFIADDLHFGGWGLSTEPNTVSTPSNQPTVSGLASTSPAPAPGGHAWSLDTSSPVSMKPCGYVVRLDVSDRTIVGSMPGQHNSNHIEVGFCLRKQ